MMRRSDLDKAYRVLAVTNTYPTVDAPGDTPCIRDQLQTLAGMGVEIDLMVIDRRKRGKLGYLSAAWQLALLPIWGKRYDLIHAFYGHSGLLSRLQLKYPVVVTFRGSDLLSHRDRVAGKLVARLVNGVIVMSKEMKIASGRRDAHIIPFEVNTGLFVPAEMLAARRELGLPLASKIVLFPWDPERPEKRFDVVEGTIRILQKADDVHLLVVHNQSHEVVARYMNASNALVLASDHEGAPMSVREAVATGLPVVSVDVGDVRNVIENVANCYICERVPADMAEKLSLAMRSNHRSISTASSDDPAQTRAAEQVLRVYDQALGVSSAAVVTENGART